MTHMRREASAFRPDSSTRRRREREGRVSRGVSEAEYRNVWRKETTDDQHASRSRPLYCAEREREKERGKREQERRRVFSVA